MHRFLWTFLLLLAGGLLLVPTHPRTTGPEGGITPERELAIKQNVLQNDVHLTDELCRRQCLADFRQTASKIDSSGVHQKGIKQLLTDLQTEHPHMKQLEWVPNQTGAEHISVGKVDDKIRTQAQAYLADAESSARSGNTYQSPRIDVDGKAYFVLGIPSQDGKAALVGLVHQSILQKVSEHQHKNLRILEYPNDNHHWKMETVDSDTLQEKQVNHPEQNEGASHYHKNEVVVKFKQPPSDADLQRIRSDIKANSVRKIGYTYVFQSDHMEAKQLMGYFQQWNVEYAEPHFLYLTNTVIPPLPMPGKSVSDNDPQTVKARQLRALGQPDILVPNDLLYRKYQWNLPIIDTELGWNISKGAKNIVVGIVDTGVDLNHPDLQGHLVKGINVVDTSSPPMDDVGHGTHVAGVITALVNNDRGVAGMTWVNPVLPVKVLDQTGAGSTYAVAQGIIWATDHGAKVINLSLGNYADANFLHDAIKYAFDHDVVLIAASGNDNTEKPGYPAAYPEVLAVAATDANQDRASFSNYGDYIDVAAPGVNIASTYPDNQYAALSGTSMASPHVTALAALVRSVNPQLKNTEVMDIIRKTATDLGTPGKDKYFGYGQIDVVKALKSALGQQDVEKKSEAPKSRVKPGEQENTSWLDWLSRLFGH
jgi:subtilisin family serine protease